MTLPHASSRSRWHVAVALALAVVADSAGALSFGGEQVQSSLGHPLKLRIALLGDAPSESLETSCFRIVPATRGEGLGSLASARIEVQRGATPAVIIRSAQPVNDPIVRLAIEHTCDTPIRRDYTVLLDPPSLNAPSAAATTAAIAPPTASSPERAAESAAAATGPATATAPVRDTRRTGATRSTPTKASTSGRRNANTAANARAPKADREASVSSRDHLQVRGDGAPAGIDDAALAALAVPRLRISSDLPTFDTATAGTPGASPAAANGADNELQAAIARERRARLLATPIDQDLAPRLEADLVVAQRRLAELQMQLSAAAGSVPTTATTAATASVDKASAPPAATTKVASRADGSGLAWRDWLWIPAALLVLGLLLFLMRQRKAREQSRSFTTEADGVTVVEDTARGATPPTARAPSPSLHADDGFDDTALGIVASDRAGAPAPAAVRSPLADVRDSEAKPANAIDRPIGTMFPLRDAEAHVDVTELSQITDEAQVYADLGRNDQAIELLRGHIDNQEALEPERASPAPWLMIFDLYRRTNNRAGYDELAPRFRKLFNGRMPDWDNYGHELALDDGLEAFPHLVARIERDWGTPEAKKYLEELLYDNRGGSRLGFSLAAYRDILLLLQLHDALGDTVNDGANRSSLAWEARGADDSDGTPKWDLSLDMIEPPGNGELDSFLKDMPRREE